MTKPSTLISHHDGNGSVPRYGHVRGHSGGGGGGRGGGKRACRPKVTDERFERDVRRGSWVGTVDNTTIETGPG